MYNEILEEEFEIIEVFNRELEIFGHKGYCSFTGDVENGYSIYKEDNYWVVEFYKKGMLTFCKKFTNVYNACLHIINEMQMDDFYFQKRDIRIPRGTKVIITTSTDCLIDELKMGVITNSYLVKKDHSQPERFYQVLDSDGRIYTGLYGLKMYGDICFRSMEDYIKDIEKQRLENIETVKELVDANRELYLQLQDVKGEKDKYLEESMFKK
jgi:hypothetical protein